MTHLQQIIAGDPQSWHEFTQAILFILALIGLFAVFMNKIWMGRGLIWLFGFLLYCVYFVIHAGKGAWNYIAAVWNGLIDYMVEAEKVKQSLTPQERAYLDETNLWV